MVLKCNCYAEFKDGVLTIWHDEYAIPCKMMQLAMMAIQKGINICFRALY